MFSSDLFSSVKGPGIIGLLLALVVLVGFGTLSKLALNEEVSGSGKSLGAKIRDADQTIASSIARIEAHESRLATIPALKKTSSDLLEAETRKNFQGMRIAKITTEIKGLQADLARVRDELADYKNQYRALVRNEAADTKIDELKTLSGDVYKEVNVRKVTAVGIEIRHRDGHKRIGFEVLPEEMQDYYQFDKDQMLAELEREAEVRSIHDTAVAVSDMAVQQKTADQRGKYEETADQKKNVKISAKESRLITITQEIQQLHAQLLSAESAARSARAAGRIHLSKAGPINNRITSKRAEYSRVQSEIATLKASL